MLTAGAVLDVFTPLYEKSMTAQALSRELGADPRATAVFLDALVALELLTKREDHYSVPAGVAKFLTEQSPDNVLPMVRHQSNCLRRWAMLSEVVQKGGPAKGGPSIRGANADQADFIGAMQNEEVCLFKASSLTLSGTTTLHPKFTKKL